MNDQTRHGLFLALMAYVIWGILPLYMKLLSHIPAMEIVMHRVIWSLPVAGIFLLLTNRFSDFKSALSSRRLLGMGVITASLIAINWLTYIYAVTNDKTLEASVGYYISPMLSIFLGATILKERLTPLQWLAIVFAFCAVLLMTYDLGKMPWIAVILSGSWCIYALCKRSLPIGAGQGFLLETVVLMPFAAGYWLWLVTQNTTHFGFDMMNTALFIGLGPATAIPLLLYSTAAKKTPLSTLAVMGYMVPSIIFLIAVFIFKEPFSMLKLIAFGMIWTGLILYTREMIRSP